MDLAMIIVNFHWVPVGLVFEFVNLVFDSRLRFANCGLDVQ